MEITSAKRAASSANLEYFVIYDHSLMSARNPESGESNIF